MPSSCSSSQIFSGRTESWTSLPAAQSPGTGAAHSAPDTSRTPPSSTTPSY